MTDSDSYEGWAARYEWFREQEPGVVEFFKTLFARHGVKTVLDCACGTGYELMMFKELGCAPVGSDLSPAMLERARKNLARSGCGEVPLHEADYRNLPTAFDGRFDAVVCWSGALFHVGDDEGALETFKSMHRVLAAGGIAVLDQGITDRRWAAQQRFSLVRSSPDKSRVYVVDYAEGRDCQYHVLDIQHTEEVKHMDVWSTDVHVLLGDDQERLLQEAGFSSVDIYGSYDFEPYSKEESLRLIPVARK